MNHWWRHHQMEMTRFWIFRGLIMFPLSSLMNILALDVFLRFERDFQVPLSSLCSICVHTNFSIYFSWVFMLTYRYRDVRVWILWVIIKWYDAICYSEGGFSFVFFGHISNDVSIESWITWWIHFIRKKHHENASCLPSSSIFAFIVTRTCKNIFTTTTLTEKEKFYPAQSNHFFSSLSVNYSASSCQVTILLWFNISLFTFGVI